jgi:acyl-CoA synthetase (AMP-forming)/AMP-acid ligase II
MISALARILSDGLSASRAIESTTGERLERRALPEHAARVADALTRRGVAPHEPVLVRIGNRPADLGTLLGVWLAGAVAAPVHASAVPATIERLQRRTQARFAVDGDRVDVLARFAPPPRALLRDAALIIFTSGSTGEPKGVVIGHAQFAGKLAVLDRLLGFRADDVVLLPLHLTFIFGLWVALMKGARLIVMPKFSTDAVVRGLADATVLAGVPSMFRTLLADGIPAAPHLRAIFTGGEVLPPRLADRMRQLGQAPNHAAIYDLYGLTETGSCDFCLAPADQPAGSGTIGKPTEGVTWRISDDGVPVAAGTAGELQIRTPFGMLGYLDDPQLTAASFDSGYFKTGDLARLRPDGFVELVGRAKEIVSRGGTKIAPLEIDHLLAEHPDVAAALCAGVPDERLGEVLHAVVVPRVGARIDVGALREWMLARTERYKVPDVFHIRDALPAGTTGKADRRAIAGLIGTGGR